MKRKWKLAKKLFYWVILAVTAFVVLFYASTRNAKSGELAPLNFEWVMRVTNTSSDGVTTAGGGFGLRSVFNITDLFVGGVECGVGVRSQGVGEQYRDTEKMVVWSAALLGLQQLDGVARYFLRGEFTSSGPVSWVGAEVDAYFFFVSMATAPTDLSAWNLSWGLLARF